MWKSENQLCRTAIVADLYIFEGNYLRSPTSFALVFKFPTEGRVLKSDIYSFLPLFLPYRGCQICMPVFDAE